MTVHRGWTQQRVDSLSATEAQRLRVDLSKQAMSADAAQRRSAFGLLRMLDGRSDGARSADERANDAREFLHPSAASKETRQRAWEVAVELRSGDEKQARRAGYRPPGEAT